VITGGASGIGAVMAKRFADGGDQVEVIDADGNAVHAFTLETGIRGHVADVTDADQMDDVFARIDGVDVLLANAGTGGPAAPVEDITLDDWRACLAVNLDGAFLSTRWAARYMKDAQQGVVILTSSTSGLFGHPERAPYATAKWGIIGLMKTLAMELGPHSIRVNAICPGAVDGPRMERVLQAEGVARGVDPEVLRQGYAETTSMRSWVTAEDIAETAHWLASDAARMISGQALAVDGHTETNRA